MQRESLARGSGVGGAHAPTGGNADIHERIAALGVSVEYRSDLPPGRLGAYLDDERRIVVRAGLTADLERETLHHEYVHATYRDRASTGVAERRAERECARMLIDEAAYAEAERIGATPLAIARQLGVSLAVVAVYQREILEGRLPDPRLRRARP
jgi:DNA topoisomerase IB